MLFGVASCTESRFVTIELLLQQLQRLFGGNYISRESESVVVYGSHLRIEFQDVNKYISTQQKNEQRNNNGYDVVVIPFWWNGEIYSLQATINFYRPDLIEKVSHFPIPLNPSRSYLQYVPDTMDVFSHDNLDSNTYQVGEITHQAQLESILQKIFPAETTLNVNSRKDSSIHHPWSKLFLELDIAIPNLKLAFEFQDEYHYKTTWYSHDPLANVQRVDNMKSEYVKRQGITLIHIPYWWNGQAGSMVSTIKFFRPDLLTDFSQLSPPIPFVPPRHYFSEHMVPDIGGEVMLASLSPQYTADLNNWWLGEKYDGIRCIWNHNLQYLYSRSGNVLLVPDTFLRSFPTSRIIDAELWYGRGSYLEAHDITRGDSSRWDFLRIIAFDDATPAVQNSAFEMRYQNIVCSIAVDHPFINTAWRVINKTKKELKAMLLNIINNHGEGVMMRRPGSLYDKGRSSNLVKIKAIRNEMEALVMGRKKATGTISLQLPTGHTIKLVSQEFVRKVKPGDIVTLKFDSHPSSPSSQRNTNNIRHSPSYSFPSVSSPSIYRIRRDVMWKDILHSYSSSPQHDQKSKLKWKESSPNILRKPHSDLANFRSVFESFAKSRGFEPLIPENWYSITRYQFAAHKGAQGILQHFGKLASALVTVFPDVPFRAAKFSTKPSRHWQDLGKRKEFFDKYAKAHSFDPLIPDNWYGIPHEAVHTEPGARSILGYYGMNVVSALTHLYPNIGLRKSRFTRNMQYWDSNANRRRLFDRIAESNSFDPLIPDNWYSLSRKEFLAHRDAPFVLEKYGKNHVKALMDLYPNIGLKEHKFTRKKSNRHWMDLSNRRKVFDRLASEIGFDPLVAQNWYNLPKNLLLQDKEVSGVLEQYKGSLINALIHVYPTVEFNKLMVLTRHTSEYWDNTENQRAFFNNIAFTRNFDPLVPSNWYSISKATIESYKHVTAVLKYYNGDHVKALIQLFPEVPFDKKYFFMEHKKYWHKTQNRIDFFTSFANENGFDPLVPVHWYTISPAAFTQPGARRLLENYGGDLANALIDTFPAIGLRKRLFSKARVS